MAIGVKTGGRVALTPNKDKTLIRNSFQLLIENNLEQLETDLKELKPFERIKVILEIAKFVVPILKATEITDVSENNNFTPLVINITRGEDIKKFIKEFNDQY